MAKKASTGCVQAVWIGPILGKGFCGLWLATKGIFMENIMLLKVSNKRYQIKARAARKHFFGYR